MLTNNIGDIDVGYIVRSRDTGVTDASKRPFFSLLRINAEIQRSRIKLITEVAMRYALILLQ